MRTRRAIEVPVGDGAGTDDDPAIPDLDKDIWGDDSDNRAVLYVWNVTHLISPWGNGGVGARVCVCAPHQRLSIQRVVVAAPATPAAATISLLVSNPIG